MLSTWRAKDVFSEDDPLYFGAPGIPALRYANYILQNCDLLIIIGTRLNPALTAYDEPHFAFQAKKVIVDVDEKEIAKLKMAWEEALVCDAKVFVATMLEEAHRQAIPSYPVWQMFCSSLKARYPLDREVQPYDIGGLVATPEVLLILLSSACGAQTALSSYGAGPKPLCPDPVRSAPQTPF